MKVALTYCYWVDHTNDYTDKLTSINQYVRAHTEIKTHWEGYLVSNSTIWLSVLKMELNWPQTGCSRQLMRQETNIIFKCILLCRGLDMQHLFQLETAYFVLLFGNLKKLSLILPLKHSWYLHDKIENESYSKQFSPFNFLWIFACSLILTVPFCLTFTTKYNTYFI